MTPQDWESPETWAAPGGGPVYGSSEQAAAYGLRPLSTGEVLDRTFEIYRAHFWLFAGLASLAGAFSLVLNAIQMVVRHVVLLRHGIGIAAVVTQLAGGVMALLLLPVEAVVYAASVFALCEVYLGRRTTAKESLQATVGQWLRYVGIALWQGWSAVWVVVVLVVPGFVLMRLGRGALGLAVVGGFIVFAGVAGGMVYGVIAYIRNSLAIPAALMEGTGVRAAMWRSKTLATDTKGRIFVVLLIAAVLYLVAGAIQSPMVFFIARSPFQEHVMAQAAVLLIGFVAHTLVSPVALIGLTLVYFDQRVRMEAFDLVMLLGGAAAPEVAAWAAAPAVEAPAPAAGDASGETAEPMGSDGQV
ncbi:MAG TPA: hypothetical protein VK814_00105 [Acidobacteriaceae bacterium]|nr:hypothetical protein [Acidobacteriaceae bacterium]